MNVDVPAPVSVPAMPSPSTTATDCFALFADLHSKATLLIDTPIIRLRSNMRSHTEVMVISGKSKAWHLTDGLPEAMAERERSNAPVIRGRKTAEEERGQRERERARGGTGFFNQAAEEDADEEEDEEDYGYDCESISPKTIPSPTKIKKERKATASTPRTTTNGFLFADTLSPLPSINSTQGSGSGSGSQGSKESPEKLSDGNVQPSGSGLRRSSLRGSRSMSMLVAPEQEEVERKVRFS